jgi:hypothetical protein
MHCRVGQGFFVRTNHGTFWAPKGYTLVGDQVWLGPEAKPADAVASNYLPLGGTGTNMLSDDPPGKSFYGTFIEAGCRRFQGGVGPSRGMAGAPSLGQAPTLGALKGKGASCDGFFDICGPGLDCVNDVCVGGGGSGPSGEDLSNMTQEEIDLLFGKKGGAGATCDPSYQSAQIDSSGNTVCVPFDAGQTAASCAAKGLLFDGKQACYPQQASCPENSTMVSDENGANCVCKAGFHAVDGKCVAGGVPCGTNATIDSFGQCRCASGMGWTKPYPDTTCGACPNGIATDGSCKGSGGTPPPANVPPPPPEKIPPVITQTKPDKPSDNSGMIIGVVALIAAGGLAYAMTMKKGKKKKLGQQAAARMKGPRRGPSSFVPCLSG